MAIWHTIYIYIYINRVREILFCMVHLFSFDELDKNLLLKCQSCGPVFSM